MHEQKSEEKFLVALNSTKGIIYKIAGIYTQNEESRKDLIQEITLQFWRSFHKYDPAFKLSTWVYRIALNVSITYFKSENRRNRYSQNLDDHVINIISNADPMEKDPNLQHLHRFISELREMDKAIIILYLEGNSQKEISEILGITTTNVSTKVGRIKGILKEKFNQLKQ